MAWSNSKVFAAAIGAALDRGVLYDFDGDTFKAALYDNDITHKLPVMRAQHLLDRVMLEHGRAAAVRAVADGIECSWGDVVVVAGVDRTELHTRLANGTVVMEEATFERLSAALG